jgi:hypothetical protein
MALPDAFLKAREKYFGGVGASELLHWRSRELHPDSNREDFLLMRQYFAHILGDAVARKDSVMFRKIAEILDALPEDDNFDAFRMVNDLNPIRFVFDARIKLEAAMVLKRSPKRELTKQEVRLLAQRLWAGERLVGRGKLKHSFGEGTAEAEKLIQDEIKLLPDQDWTELFKKAGCADLKHAPAGRPSKKPRN